jgi:hypothetical protein
MYRLTFYANIDGHFIVGRLTCSLVMSRIYGNASWQAWLAVGIGARKMNSLDIWRVSFEPELKVADYYSNGSYLQNIIEDSRYP